MRDHPQGFVLQLTRLLDAPPDRIFAVLTEPADLAEWWGPLGFTIPEVDLHLEVGGTYRFEMQPPDGEPFHLSGRFLQIQPPSRLVYTFSWDEPDPDDRETVVALSLTPSDGRTAVSLSQGEFATEARLELHRTGWTESFQKLDALLRSET